MSVHLAEEIRDHVENFSHRDSLEALTLMDRAIRALELVPNPHCGFSCNGVNLQGDKHSISMAQEWKHYADQVESFWRPEVLRLRAQLEERKPRLALGHDVTVMVPNGHYNIGSPIEKVTPIKGKVAKVEITVWCEDFEARTVGPEDIR